MNSLPSSALTQLPKLPPKPGITAIKPMDPVLACSTASFEGATCGALAGLTGYWISTVGSCSVAPYTLGFSCGLNFCCLSIYEHLSNVREYQKNKHLLEMYDYHKKLHNWVITQQPGSPSPKGTSEKT